MAKNDMELASISQDERTLNIITDTITGKTKYYYYDALTGDYVEVKKEHLKFLDLGFDRLIE